MNKTEFKKSFPFLSATVNENSTYYIGDYAYLRHDYKTERGYIGKLNQMEAECKKLLTMPDLARVCVDITWRKSRTWGNCPTAEMRAWDKEDNFYEHTAYASGCGYDKGSTVLAECLNTCIRGMLYRKRRAIQSKKIKTPYGISRSLDCEGGVGISCYYAIAKFLGGKMTWKSGKTWDYIEIVF